MIKTAYRYATPALKGCWRQSREEAVSDALLAGQAFVRSDEIVLFEFTRLETQAEHLCGGSPDREPGPGPSYRGASGAG